MKISTKDIYDEYVLELKIRRKSLSDERESYLSSKNYTMSKIESLKHYIENFTNIRYNDIKDLTRMISSRSVVQLTNVVGIDVTFMTRSINVIVEINKSLEKIDKEIKQIEVDLIGYLVFKEIIYKFDCKISDEVVYKGYALALGFGLGHIRIKKINCFFNRDGSNRVKKRINWNASNKKRKEIEDSGGVSYKVTKREGRKIIEDNGGEHWFVYHANEWDYLWHWYKGKCIILNTPYYRFRPTIYNNSSRYGGMGNVNKLKQLVTANSDLLSNFTETIVDKGHRRGHLDTLWKGR